MKIYLNYALQVLIERHSMRFLEHLHQIRPMGEGGGSK